MNKRNAYLLLSLGMALAGSSVVVGKILVDAMPIYASQFLVLLIALVAIIPASYCIEGSFKTFELTRMDVLYLFLQSLTGMFLFRIFLLEGLKRTTAMESGIITSTAPAILAILSIIMLKEIVKRNVAIGIFICVIGIMIINSNLDTNTYFGNYNERLIGNGFLLLAVIGESLFSIFRKKQSFDNRPLTSSAIIIFFSFVLFAPLGIVELVTSVQSISSITWGALAFYALLCTVLAYICWFKGIAQVEVNVAAGFAGVMPITSVTLSIIVLGEPLTLKLLLGSIITLLGIYTISNPLGLFIRHGRLQIEKRP